MPEQRRYDVDWTDENNPQIVIAQPDDQHAMTIGEAQLAINEAAEDSSTAVTVRNTDAGSITIGDPNSAQTVEIARWTSEETEHYNQTGETPLDRLHRENLAELWNSAADRATEK